MTVLDMSLSAAILILAIVIIRALLLHRLPKKTFLVLWGVALCRLLVPFEVSSRFSIYSAMAMLKNRFYEADLSLAEVLITPDRAVAENSVISSGTTSASISPVLIIWLIGLVACALFFLVTHLRCRKEYKTALPVDNEFVKIWQQKHSMWRNIHIRQSDRISAPLTYGIFRPVVLLPKQIDWTDKVRLRYILTHEFVHIRRFDTLTKLVMATALCVHWFNPLVWVMYILGNRDIEISCDETVVRTIGGDIRSSYALTLIGLEETKGHSVSLLVNFFSKNAVIERITAIMKIKKYTIPAIIVAIFLVVGVTVAFATSNAAADREDDAYLALEQALEEEDDAYLALERVLEEMEYISTATVSLSGPDYVYVKLTLDGTDTLDREKAVQILDLAQYAFSDKSIKINCGGVVKGGDSSIVGWAVAVPEE